MGSQEIIVDLIESSKLAGLRYVSDAKPGIRRRRWGEHFRYFDADGKIVRDKNTLGRIRSLVIPPAWTDVWICPIANGHLQATGRDAKKRKQSRYHTRWRQVRDETKYERMRSFGESLPSIRERVDHDLARPGLPRQKVLATIVRLLETTFIRVGNEEYARENHSYGLTTLRNHHVNVDGSTVRFNFKGKSGKRHTIDLNNRRLARIVKRCLDLPGYELFQYLEEDGSLHSIDAADVNEYLREISNQPFTAKDFRTWAGSVLACTLLYDCGAFDTDSQAKKNVVQAIASVSGRLGNTPAVCRKCYIHPQILECYLCGEMLDRLKHHMEREDLDSTHGLRKDERALMLLLHDSPNRKG